MRISRHMEGKGPNKSPFLFGLSQNVSTTLYALLTRSTILLGLFPNSLQYPLGASHHISNELYIEALLNDKVLNMSANSRIKLKLKSLIFFT